MLKSLTLAACAVTLGLSAQAATLQDQFTFDNGLANSAGSATATGAGTVTGGVYDFDKNQGLTVSGLGGLTDFTIVMRMRFDSAMAGYRKIIDMTGLTSDTGLYDQAGTLLFWPASSQTVANAVSDQFQTIAMAVSGPTITLINGAGTSVQSAYSFSETLTSFVAVEDDTATSGTEAEAGEIDWLQVYDGALTGAQVAAISGPTAPAVPLPSSALLLVGALGGLAAARRRG